MKLTRTSFTKTTPRFKKHLLPKPVRGLRVAGCLTILLTGLVSAAVVEDPESTHPSAVNFLQAPAGAQVFAIPLSVADNPGAHAQGYLSQRSPRSLEEMASVPPAIAAAYAGKQVSAYQIALLPDGTRYVAVLDEDNGQKLLNRNDNGLWYARIYLVPKDVNAKPEIVKEGFQLPGNDVLVPVEIQLPGIGTTKLKSFATQLGYNINGTQNGKPSLYSGRGSSLQVAGSHVLKEGKLTVTVTVPDEMSVTPDTQVSLRFEPLQPGLPDHNASGKLTDFLTLGAARFVVTALAPDFSSISVALAAGSLEETLKQQLQLGAQMPGFSQVDLLNRKTVTQRDILLRAKSTPGAVFVFGDLESSSGRFGPYGTGFRPGGTTALPLPPAEVADQLGPQGQTKPVLIFVTRQIGLDFLYTELRNKAPDYVVLADYTDPLRTGFRQPQSNMGPWYGSPPYGNAQEPSLRQLFNLPGNTIAIAAFDGQGNVRYVKADAASTFLASLAEARSALTAKSGR